MSDVHGATGTYALNALEAVELGRFRGSAQLATCGPCEDQVAKFWEIAAEFSLPGMAAVPAPTLRARGP
jgi:hypothetical protein